ncbi:leucine-rich_repeat domain-containing protein [Hexamita inflata]|uniref:Leucine-rich repeat domain-containing protein n=1 Tax=Hexamita inflata TaxID=28002 RepID=A0AA86QSX8_9EUKA|nr:leucine-rich repeat domain-containing protein [Hexamita inflata]
MEDRVLDCSKTIGLSQLNTYLFLKYRSKIENGQLRIINDLEVDNLTFVEQIEVNTLIMQDIYDATNQQLINFNQAPSNIQLLHINNCRLSNIQGVEYMMLQQLDLSNNNISDISALTTMFCIKSLNLARNQIFDLSALRLLIKLNHLDLSCNKINDLTDISQLNELISLLCVGNEVSDLSPLSNMSILTHLDASYNQIQNISVLGLLNNLQYVNLRSNYITDAHLLNHLPLQTLIVDQQQTHTQISCKCYENGSRAEENL